MKAEARQIDIFGALRLIQTRQDARDLFEMLRIETAIVVPLVEPFQSPVAEALDYQR